MKIIEQLSYAHEVRKAKDKDFMYGAEPWLSVPVEQKKEAAFKIEIQPLAMK
ncbi:MAG: hypothetical protein OEQ53_02760 [Saprospiraceae bacterium]|nr:hypothetical protein [Saprospiraceae bacterium]